MTRSHLMGALLCGSAIFIRTASRAQEPEPTEPDASDATADAAIAEATPLDDAQAKIELLQAQVEALQESLAGVQAQITKTAPSWKGAPLFEDKDEGWSFKPRGRIQYDAGWVVNPDDDPNGGLLTRNLGFNTRARRIRLGAEGTIPGGFGYKFEMDFANAATRIRRRDPDLCRRRTSHTASPSVTTRPSTASSRSPARASRRLSSVPHSTTHSSTRAASAFQRAWSTRPATCASTPAFLRRTRSTRASTMTAGSPRRALSTRRLTVGNQLHFGANVQFREFHQNNGSTTSSDGWRAVHRPARPLSCSTLFAADRRALRRYGRLCGEERLYSRPRSGGHL